MDNIKINLKIKYATLVIGVSITILLAIVSAVNSFPIETIVAIVGGGIALTALVYTAINLHLTSDIHLEMLRTKKLENSMVFIEFSSSPEMIKAVNIGMKIRDEVRGRDIKEIKEIFENNPEKQEAILMIFNYFERLGIIVRSGAADESALREYYRGAIKRYWHSLKPWIIELRKDFQDDNLMKEMEKLVDRWN